MIISANSNPGQDEFNRLVNSMTLKLNSIAQANPKKIKSLKGTTLEPFVKEQLDNISIGTPFENSIELIGGQKFPDIVAKKYYGIEVKTTTQNKWTTTGNSVMESTRVDGVERIYMLFAKLADPVEFRCRPYEHVLSDVVVTHSPRYHIDMNLETGCTIFDKMNLEYDELRKASNPIKPIVDYYKNGLKKGDELWWIDSESLNSTNFIIRLWNNLPQAERRQIVSKAMAYFPELFGNSSHKYDRFAIWLNTREAIVCPNIRDPFSAGGKGELLINGSTLKNVPRIYINLSKNIREVIDTIINTSDLELSNYWQQKVKSKNKVHQWIDLVAEYSKMTPGTHHLNLNQILTDINK